MKQRGAHQRDKGTVLVFSIPKEDLLKLQKVPENRLTDAIRDYLKDKPILPLTGFDEKS